jgi:hypothetical protein
MALSVDCADPVQLAPPSQYAATINTGVEELAPCAVPVMVKVDGDHVPPTRIGAGGVGLLLCPQMVTRS